MHPSLRDSPQLTTPHTKAHERTCASDASGDYSLRLDPVCTARKHTTGRLDVPLHAVKLAGRRAGQRVQPGITRTIAQLRVRTISRSVFVDVTLLLCGQSSVA